MKKLLAVILPIALLFGCVGCSNSKENGKETVVEQATMVLRLQDLDVDMTQELVDEVVEKSGFDSGELDEDKGVVIYTMSLEKAAEYKEDYLDHIGKVFQNRLDQDGSNITGIHSDGNYEKYEIRVNRDSITEEEVEEFEALVELAMKNIHSMSGINKYEYEFQYVDNETDEVLSTTTGSVENSSSSFSFSI